MTIGGYTGNLAYVDLTGGNMEYREISERDKRLWIGGSGMGAKILMDECKLDTHPLSPDNPLIFMTGPMTGTNIPGSGRHQVVTKSPLTEIYGEADAGGKWGTVLKRAGFDGLIFKGKAERPAYAFVHEKRVQILDADFLWGLDNYQVNEVLQERHGQDSAVASIGPAGENQVLIATILHEGKKGRSAGRGGLGAVMGSKNLKAIVVKGDNPIAVYDKAALQVQIDAVTPGIAEKTKGLQDYGTAGALIGSERIGDLPVKNWSQGTWSEIDKISGQTMADSIVKGKSKCHSCPVSCGRTVKSDSSYGSVDGKGPEYETLGMFGGACMVSDLDAIVQANEICNRYGIDTISSGGAIAFLMDIYEQGLIADADIIDAEGQQLQPLWGDAKAMLRLLHSIGRQRGIGKLLGQGVRRAAEAIGNGTEDYAFHVKGLELPAHDPRAFNSLALGYATSNRGACHLQGGSYFFEKVAILPEIGITEVLDRFRADNHGFVQACLQNTMSVMDSLKLCKFLFYGGIDLTIITGWLNALTGFNYTVEEVLTAGERIFTIKRMFNVQCGISSLDDTLPRRIAEVPRPDGGAADNLPPLAAMLAEYYEARGWDDHGRPLSGTINRLGLG